MLAWPAGFAFGFLRGLCGVSLKGIRDQVGVFPQPVGMALDLDDDGMVQQAVQQGRGHDVIAEDSAPVSEAAIGGEHGGAFLVAGIDQLEEQVGAAGFDRQVANLIDDQQGDPVNIAQARLEGTGAFGLGKGGWNESGLPGPGSWPRWTPVDNSVGVKPASTTAPTHLMPVADPPDPIPTQRRDLLKPGCAKARIGHDNRPATDRQHNLQLSQKRPVRAPLVLTATYAPLHTRWQSDRSPPHSPATDNGVCAHPGPTNPPTTPGGCAPQ